MASFASDNDTAAAAAPHLVDMINQCAGTPFMSVEFFPPKTDVGVTSLGKVMGELKKRSPLFADVTWGAGGSTSELTLELCKRAKTEHGLNPNLHLTCTNMEMAKITEALEGCQAAGITNILALRGDPPAGQEAWTATEGGFTCALDLVKHIKKQYGDYFCVSVAGYPEGHPNAMTVVEGGTANLTPSELQRCAVDVDEATGQEVVTVCRDADYAAELRYLKEKVDAGAACIITQMFFDTAVFEAFVVACRGMGITVPIVPGIMMVSNYGGFTRMAKFCKTRVPAEMKAELAPIKDDEEAVKAFGLAFGVRMCKQLLAAGAVGLHFYTLNSSVLTGKICDQLGYTAVAVVAQKEEKVEEDKATERLAVSTM
jgi:methylenetetrahydrofolate reductase (NADPH)